MGKMKINKSNRWFRLFWFSLALTLGLMVALAGSAMAQETHTHTVGEETKTFTAWDSDNSLPQPTTEGSYYLTKDVTLSSTWNIENGKTVNLCLNGHTITGSGTSSVIHINEGGTLNLFDESENKGTITGGKAGEGEFGGGVWSQGTFTMKGGTISGNTAAGNNGGGVSVDSNGSFTMEGGTISGNTAKNGSGVFVAGSIEDGEWKSGTFIMNGGTISGNTATAGDDGGNGGGVYNYGTFTMEGGTISENTAKNGGGVYSGCMDNSGSGVSFKGTFTMKGGKICKNTSDGCGSGVNNDGTFTMDGGEITENIGASLGGGVYSQSPFTMNGGTISGNSADNGGSVFTQGGFTMKGGTISGNNSNGCNMLVSGTFIMDGGEISENTSKYDGGGVHLYGGNFTMNGGTISGNKTDGKGGGVSVDNTSTFTMKGGTISGNKTNDSYGEGGGVYNEGTFTMENTMEKGGTISENTARYGGGVSNKGTFTMKGGTISENTAKNDGGGVYSNGGESFAGTFTMEGGTISNNNAESCGGGIYVDHSNSKTTLSVEPTITDNKVGNGINNIYLVNGKTITVGENLNPQIPIGVTLEEGSGGITTNGSYTSDNDARRVFTSDNPNYIVYSNNEKQAALKESTAQDVIAMINELPNVNNIQPSDQAAVDAARAAYDALPDKHEVTNIDKLTAAENKLSDLLNQAKEEAKSALDTLQSQKGSEENHNNYDDAEWTALKKAVQDGKAAIDSASTFNDVNKAKQDAINAVNGIKTMQAKLDDFNAKMEQIPTNPSDVTLNDKDKIQAAREAYDALNETQKQDPNVQSKLNTLQAAEAALLLKVKAAAIQELEQLQGQKGSDENHNNYDDAEWTALKKAIDDGKNTINNSATDTIAKVDAEKQKAIDAVSAIKTKMDKVVDMINNLPASGEVTADNETAIQAARTAYANLNDAQKQQTNVQNVLWRLENAELALEKIKAKAALDTLQNEKGNDLNHSAYDDAEWTALKKAVEDGKDAIDNAGTIDQVTTEKDTATEKVNSIKTKEQKLADFNTKMGQVPTNPENVTLNDKDKIQAAREAYDALNADQKNLNDVKTKLTTLQAAEAALLPKVKAAAIQELEQLQGQKGSDENHNNYDDAEWTALKKAIDDGKNTINNSATDTIAKVDAEKQKAIDAVSAIKTKEQKLADFNTKMGQVPTNPSDVTLNDKDKIQAARAAYNALNDDQKANEDVKAALAILEAAEEALRKVDQQSGSGSSVSPLDAAKQSAKANLDALRASKNQADYAPEDWQALTKAIDDGKKAINGAKDIEVVNKAKADAESAVNAIKTKEKKLNDYIDFIIKTLILPESNHVKPSDREAIQAARAAYDALSDEQKAQVPAIVLKRLTDAEAKIAEIYPEVIKAAKESAKSDLDTLKGNKNQNDYDPQDWEALQKAIEDGKANIDSAEDLEGVDKAKADAQSAVGAIKTKSEKVADAKEKIGALPDKDKVQPMDKKAIDAARAAYDALSDAGKGEITPAEMKKLTDAEEKIAEIYPEALKAAKESAKSDLDTVKGEKNQNDYDPQDWEALQKAIEDGKIAIDGAEDIEGVNKAKADAQSAVNAIMTKAEKLADAIDKINDLPTAGQVKASNKDAIKAARAAYDALSDAQKAQVPADVLKKLEDAEKALDKVAPDQPTVYLRSHVQDIGWQTTTTKIEPGTSDTIGTTGRSLRLEALDMVVPENYKVTGFAHIQNVGDTDVIHVDKPDYRVPEGYTVYRFGTTGRALRMEAVEIHLLDENDQPVEGFQYASHLQDIGWEGYVKNGSFTGTRSQSRRLEALRFAYPEADKASQ